MSMAHVQSPTAVITAATTSHQITIPSVTPGSLIVVFIGWNTEAQTATCADDQGNTYTPVLGPIDSGNSALRCYHFYAKNVAGGTTVITVTTTGAVNGSLHAGEYSGAHLTAPLDVSGSADLSGTNPTMNLVPTGAGMIIGFFRTVSNKNFTAGGSYTARSTSTRGDVEDRQVTAGTVAVDGTFDASELGLILAASYFEEPAGGGGSFQFFSRSPRFFRRG